MLRLSAEPPRKKASAMPECSRLMFGIALLLTIISDGALNGQYTALSTVITATSDPTALQQLATFAAMEDVAEEEHLDWGSAGRLVQTPAHTVTKPRNAVLPPAAEKLAAEFASSGHTHRRTDSEGAASDGLSKSLAGVSTDEAASGSSAASSSSSRHRPHRRHRRGGASSSTESDTAADALVESRPVHSYPMWTQFHVMEMAYSTGANNFVHITERFVQCQHMFPVIYRCDLNKVDCPYEAELLASPTVGLAASSRWACEDCGKRHDVVRESCLRCRTPGPYAKLFVGQAVKEVDCAESLVRFMHATHPDVVLHRVECHHDTHAGVIGRGRGCASVYVRREDAATLQALLHHNAFFDVDAATGGLVAYYVYAEQQQWLHAFVQERTATAAAEQRPLFLPLAPLVVEESASAAVATPAGPDRRAAGRVAGRPQRGDRQGLDVAAAPLLY